MTPNAFWRGDPNKTRNWLRHICWVLILAFVASMPRPIFAAEKTEPQKLVNKARQTIEDFKVDPDMTWFRDHLPDAKAVLIVPVLVKGGLIIGGSGGHGALLWHDEATDSWSYPAFYFMGSVTFGLQIGGEVAEVVLMINSERGRDAFLTREFKLGADVSVAAGPVGAGAKVATADVLSFSRDKGLFGGLVVEGAVIEPRDKWNRGYYDGVALPTDILVRQTTSNSGADPLRLAVASARAAAMPSSETHDLAVIQNALSAKGYDPGPADGLMGPKTRDAIGQFQSDNGLAVTREPSAALQQILTGGP
jgi:lipid-binding SYLF domain-containing protein